MDTAKAGAADKNKRLVVIALLLTAATIVVLKLYASSIESKYSEIENPVRVMASLKAVPEGGPINDLAVKVMPAKHVHPDSILCNSQADIDLYKGAKAMRKIDAKQILLLSDVMPKESQEARETLGTLITEGYRAVTVRADIGSIHGGLLRTGDRVDVLCTVADPKLGDTITKTLLQNVTVLAVGGQIRAPAFGKSKRRSVPSVTVEVSPEDAEMLVFAQQKGELSLIVRPQADTSTAKLVGKSFWDVFDKAGRGPQNLDDVAKTLRAAQEELKGINGLSIKRIGDKIVITGIIYTEDEIQRVAACATKHGDAVENKSTANPRPTEDLKRRR